MKPHDAQTGRDPAEIMGEAFALARHAPLGTLACYYVGSLPFVLALLYFWADMSRSPLADQHCLGGSLALAGLFVWMKSWQAVYAGRLLRSLAGDDEPPWTARRTLRLAAWQTIAQPAGLYLLPLAAIALLPLAWVYAFYQNASAFGDDPAFRPWRMAGRSWRQATLWARQNHAILLVWSVFATVVFINLFVTILLLPWLAKTLLGWETAFSRLRMGMLNTTTLAAAAALTYLCVDPLIKATYVLRCFYGESLQTGADLKAELRRLGPARRGAIAVALAGALALAAGELRAAPAPPPAGASARPAAQPSARRLDRAIGDVLDRPEFAWRAPRKSPDGEGIAGRFFTDLSQAVGRTLNWLAEALRRLFRSTPLPGGRTSAPWLTGTKLLLFALAGVVAIALVMLLRSLLGRRGRAGRLAAEPVQAAPDLTREDVGAEELPEDGWSALAAEMLARGELRLALRALYLSSLAYLAQRELITLRRFKSNLDYRRELARRGHGPTELVEAFGGNVRIFEDAWYGLHDVTAATVDQFNRNQERIRVHGQA